MSTELFTPASTVKQLSPAKIVLLHLLPGALIALVYALLVNPMTTLGLPKLVTLGVVSILVLVPVELGCILYCSKKELGRTAILAMIPYREKLHLKDYFIWVPLLFIWAGLIASLTKSLAALQLEQLFYWIPDWYLLNDKLELFPKNTVLLAFLSCFFLTGIIAPIVEELYSRGFLLPRMACFGKFAPLVNSLLFAVYHFWSPWMILTRTILMLPMAHVVQWKRNVNISIIVHCLMNVLGDAVVILVMFLKM